MRILILISILLTSLTTATAVFAKQETKTPYYASIKADEANIRTGPSVKYPIQWVYKKKTWPVKVTATFEGWRKIEDINGEAGWIHRVLLSDRRTVLINTNKNSVQEIYRLPILTSKPILIVEKGVIAKLISCKKNWCKISLNDENGWIERKYLWGTTL